jgi:DNA transformation protein
MPASLSTLPNLGPKSRAMLAAAGITSLAQLRRLGAVAAYSRVRRRSPKASLNLLWALEGALTGLPWQQVAREHRTSLLLALETHEKGGTAFD